MTPIRAAAALAALAAALPALCGPTPSMAHAFGARYDLPIPLWLWVSAAGAVVGLSFVVVALFLPARSLSLAERRFDLGSGPAIGALAHPVLLEGFRLVSVVLFLLVIIAGLFGNQTTTKNIAPVLVWVIWWVGLAYLAALLGDIWRLFNPWDALFGWAESRFGFSNRRLRAYPAWVGAWPAAAFFLAFAWLELVSESGEMPARLSSLILLYSAATWLGMYAYGREAWLSNAEAFSVCFGLLARFGVVEGRRGDGSAALVLRLRPPAVGLLVDRPVPLSMVAFVVLLLATVSFDGISETPFWAGVLDWFAENPAIRPMLLALREADFDLLKTIKTLGLVATALIFFAAFMSFSWLTMRAGGGGLGLWQTAGAFVFSLVPIAIAYHLSHYFSYLLLAGQLVIPLASDPLGLGWNLFGTSAYAIDISVVSARMVWYLATAAIVMGHVFAICLGHVMALRLYQDRAAALRSQGPLIALMVAYTMLSLWILSQPVVELN